MKLNNSMKAPLVILVAFLLAFSTIVAFSPLRSVAVATPSATPNLTSITFVDYGGSDASGVADLQANKIDAYDFALTPSASQSLPSSYDQYTAPASIYGLYINPQNTTTATGQYNPFYYQSVRFALNYLIDRSYFGQTIEGGDFVQCIAAVCAEPDSVTVAGAMAAFSNVTFNFAFANQTIYNTLTANKVTYTNHQYFFDGKAVTINLFDRTDDPIRHAFMQYLSTQLQAVGFAVHLIPGTLSVAYSVVFGADPANATYDIYPASNSQIWGYYDSNAINFYSVYYEDLPASDTYGTNWIGGWDNTTQQAYSTSLYNSADKYAIPLINSNYTTITQRNSLLANLTYYGVLGATYITLGTSLAPYATTGAVSGVTPNFLQDPFGNYQNYLTMSVSASGASGTANALKLGVRHITNGAVNPVGGDDDAYSDVMLQAQAIPLYAFGPSTGYEYSTGMTYAINGNSFAGSIAVPSSAIWFNGTSDKWATVAANLKAQDDVTVNVANLLSHTTWSDGQPVTLADMLMQYLIEARVVSPGNPLSDSGGEHGIYSVSYSQVEGIQVLNSTSLRIWTTNTFFPDANLAALGAIVDVLSPLGYAGYTNGLGYTPWQMYYAMSQVVTNKQAAWSTATATTKSIPWLSLINPTDVANVKAALTAAGSTIPPELTQLQTLTGQTWVTSTSAAAGYTAAINFINTNGVAVIGDGPFYITQYSSSTSPAFMVMKQNPGFQAGSIANPNALAQAVVLTPKVTIPPTLTSGGSFTVTVLQTPDGAPSTQATPANNATVVVQLVLNGATKFSTTLQTGSTGAVTVTLPTSLPAGTYQVSIYAQSVTSKLITPVVQSLTLSSASSTASSSTSQQSSASMTTSSSSTSTSSSTYTLIAAVVVIVIVIAGLGLYMMRRGKTPSAST
jgi:peptide/nickel transport system substrate-binding protein